MSDWKKATVHVTKGKDEVGAVMALNAKRESSPGVKGANDVWKEDGGGIGN
jgi:hypothetical protein